MSVLTNAYKQFNPDLAVTLITIRHPALSTPLRLCNVNVERFVPNPVYVEDFYYVTRSRMLVPGIVREGFNLAEPAIFEYALMTSVRAEDREDGATATEIVFDNVDGRMVDEVRKLKTPAFVDMATVSADDPDTVDDYSFGLRTVSAGWDEATITLSVSYEQEANYAYPHDTMHVNYFPGMF